MGCPSEPGGTQRTGAPAWAARWRLAWLVAAAAASACQAAPQATYAPEYATEAPRESLGPPVYRFAVHPLHNPQRLAEVYGPIVAYLNRRLGGPVLRLEASRSYADFEARLLGRAYDLALPNPIQALQARRSGYRIFGKMGDDERFRGLILVRRDSGLESVASLRGQVLSFPAPTALAATLMPLWYLQTHGLDTNRDIRRVYTGSQESAIRAVVLGTSAAAGTWPAPWEQFQRRSPELAAQLVARWETAPLVNNALVARDDLPPELVERVARLLFSLHETPEGRRLLAEIPVSRFEPADAATYRPVQAFLDANGRLVQ